MQSVILLAAALSVSQTTPAIEPAQGVEERAITYKTVGGRDLQYWLYESPELAAEPKPAILFFHGGGWSGGSHKQFEPHAKHLAKLGFIIGSAEYRLTKRDKCKAVDCVDDTWDAYRHFREHATEYGINPERIAVGGGSAGGHLSACLGTGTYSPSSVKTDDTRPAAMFLFNPAVCLAPYRDSENASAYTPIGFEKGAIEKRVGCEPMKLSPLHHVDEKTPPAVVFHGDADTTVGIESANHFCLAIQKQGREATLFRYEGRGHGFFNQGRKNKQGTDDYADTLEKLEASLRQMGWLD